MSTSIRNSVYTQCCKFFRIRLLTSAPELIEKIVEGMDNEVKSLKEDMLKMVWYMRGGVTYSEIVNMSQPEREYISALIKGNLETAKKTGRDFW